MAQDTPIIKDVPLENRKEPKKLYLWSRSTEGPVGEHAPGSEPQPRTAAAPGSTTSPEATSNLDPKDFQANFPQAQHNPSGHPTLVDGIKTVKPDDFLTVTQTPCARDGFLTGIASGAGIGGLRYVFRGAPIKAANWAVGGFLAGAIGSFEYCQYKRRQERVQMKRTIEVYQESVAERQRREADALKKQHEEMLAEEQAKKANRSWYKFW